MNRFDLEQNILDCWNLVDELKLLSKQNELSNDEYRELLNALHLLYDIKFKTLFYTFEKYIEM